MHKLAMEGESNKRQIKRHYGGLSDPEQDKILELIRLYDGLHIYMLG